MKFVILVVMNKMCCISFGRFNGCEWSWCVLIGMGVMGEIVMGEVDWVVWVMGMILDVLGR